MELNSPFGNSQAYINTSELPKGENAESRLNSMFKRLSKYKFYSNSNVVILLLNILRDSPIHYFGVVQTTLSTV